MKNDFKFKKWRRLPKVNIPKVDISKLNLPSINIPNQVNIPQMNVNRRLINRRMNKIEGATVKHVHRFVIKRWDNVRESQMRILAWILAMGILIAATGLQLMWSQESYKATIPAVDGTYAEATLGPVNTLNPIFASTSAERSASYLMFSRLMNYDTAGSLNYDLATNVQIDATNTVYTVTIRSDAVWHDGIKLTADDVVFTVNLIKDPSTRSTITGWDNVSVVAVNEATVQFTIKSAYAAFEHALTFPILPKHILSNVLPANIRENNFSQNPIGSGPFKLSFVQNADTNSGEKVVYMSRNDDYYRGSAKLKRFQLYVYNTSSDILKALSSHEVNAATDLLPIEADQADSKQYNITSEPIQSGVYALINTRSSFLSDVVVRRALQVATNTQAIRDKLPEATVDLYLPFTNGQITGNVPTEPQFNLESAKQILEGAGWKLNGKGIREKDGKELSLSVVTIKNSELETTLEVLAGQWRALGVAIDTKVIDSTDITQNFAQTVLQPRNFDVLLYQLNIGADPDVYAYWHSSQASTQGLNFSNYSNTISDDALTSARARTELALRNAKYITFARQWLSDVPAIGLYQSTMQYVSNKSVQSFDMSNSLVSSVDRYSDVLNWSVGTRDAYKTP